MNGVGGWLALKVCCGGSDLAYAFAFLTQFFGLGPLARNKLPGCRRGSLALAQPTV